MYCLCCCRDGLGPKPLNRTSLIVWVQVVRFSPFSIYLISTSIFRHCDGQVLHLYRRETKMEGRARVAKETRNGGQDGVRKKTSTTPIPKINTNCQNFAGTDSIKLTNHGGGRMSTVTQLLECSISVVGKLFVRWFRSRSWNFLIGYCSVAEFFHSVLLFWIKINQLKVTQIVLVGDQWSA